MNALKEEIKKGNNGSICILPAEISYLAHRFYTGFLSVPEK
jgi:hypothetical protein